MVCIQHMFLLSSSVVSTGRSVELCLLVNIIL